MGTSAYCVVPMWIENQGHIGEFLLKFAYVVFLYLEERRDSMLLLEVANYEDREKEYEFVRDMPHDENGLINEWHGISKEDFDERALKIMIANSKGELLPNGYVPATIYFLWRENEIVGQFRIRHYLNDFLREGGGHIGYFIHKKYRGNGYATEGLRLTLEEARKIVLEDEIYFRVSKDNSASLKVILNNGGYIFKEDETKYYVRIKK